ncbi:MAG: hypothetical protein ACJ8GW_12440 [Massilia sp.]
MACLIFALNLHKQIHPMSLNTDALQRLASLILCVCFFLPMSSCTKKEVLLDAAPSAAKITNVDVVDIIPAAWLERPSFGNALSLLIFFWPAAVQLLRIGRRSNMRAPRWLALQLLLALGTIAGVTQMAMTGDRIRYGALMAYAAISIYLAATLIEWQALRRRRLVVASGTS